MKELYKFSTEYMARLFAYEMEQAGDNVKLTSETDGTWSVEIEDDNEN